MLQQNTWLQCVQFAATSLATAIGTWFAFQALVMQAVDSLAKYIASKRKGGTPPDAEDVADPAPASSDHATQPTSLFSQPYSMPDDVESDPHHSVDDDAYAKEKVSARRSQRRAAAADSPVPPPAAV